MTAAATQKAAPIVVFVHGRGQESSQEASVRQQVLGTFAASQRRIYGREVVPAESESFVWYADTIDPGRNSAPRAPGCQFLENENAVAEFATTLRVELMELASKAGLDSLGLRVLTEDTHKYLTRVAVRCEADTRLERELVDRALAERPVVLVAHSMGGIVSFSALQKNAQTVSPRARLKVLHFVTLGTQVGLKPILQGLVGQYATLPVPVPNTVERWTNFRNSGDALAFPLAGSFTATDPTRTPQEQPINASGATTGGQHGIATYLSSDVVVKTIVSEWCRGHVDRPAACALSAKNNDALGGAVRPANLEAEVGTTLGELAGFFKAPKPAFRLTDLESTHSAPATPSEPGGTVVFNGSQLAVAGRHIAEFNFENAMFFTLAHESAHLARCRNSPSSCAGAEAAPRRVLECDADILAAAAFVLVTFNIAAPLDRAAKSLNSFVAFATETGQPYSPGHNDFDNETQHPARLTRAVCVARGLNAGMFLLTNEKLPGNTINQAVGDGSNIDGPSLDVLKTRADIVSWSLRAAEAIVKRRLKDTTTIAPQWERLAAASEEGREALRRSESPEKIAGFECAATRATDFVSVECKMGPASSRPIVHEAYESFASGFRDLLRSRGWDRTVAESNLAGLREVFARGMATASIQVIDDSRSILFRFEARH
jgi:hypothetical protein